MTHRGSAAPPGCPAPCAAGSRCVALTTATLLMVILTVAFNTVDATGTSSTRRTTNCAPGPPPSPRPSTPAAPGCASWRRRRRACSTRTCGSTPAAGCWRSRPRPPPPARSPAPPTRLAAQGGTALRHRTDSPRSVRLCARPVPAAQHRPTVVTALDLAPYRGSADTLLSGRSILDAVMLACTYALTRLAVGRALRPVRTMTDQATQWSAVGLRRTLRQPCDRPGRTRPPGRVAGRAAGPHPRRAAPRAAADRRAVARTAHPAHPDHRRARLVAGPPALRRRDPRHPRGDRGRRPVHAHHLRHAARRRPRRHAEHLPRPPAPPPSLPVLRRLVEDLGRTRSR